jgi:hypothetical protein
MAVAILAVSCPVGSAVLQAGNHYYEVAVNGAHGAYTAGTGALHPVTTRMGERSKVLRFGGNFTPGSIFNAVRSWSSGTDYRLGNLPSVIQASPGFECVTYLDLDPPEVRLIDEPGGVAGIAQTWDIAHGADRFLLEQQVLARGETFTESAVQVTLRLTNLSGDRLRIGAAFYWDYALGNTGGSAGPVIGPKPPECPDEPFVLTERRFEPPGFRSYVLSNEEFPSSPIFGNPYINEGTIGGLPIEPPPTRPDRFQQTYLGWPFAPPAPEGLGPVNSCFGFEIADPPRYVLNESAGYYQWGPTEDSAIDLAPGESWSATQYIFAYLEFPLFCDAGGPYLAECQGPVTEIPLDGSGSENITGEALHHLWSAADPGVRLRDEKSASPVAEIDGLGKRSIELLVHNGPYASGCATEIAVVDRTPPVIHGASVAPSFLWPPNHKMVAVRVTIDAEDVCEGESIVRLLDVRSDEPDDARGVGDGQTSGDIRGADLGTDDREVLLRAERNGTGDGRVYTLTYSVSDSSGNTVLLPLRVLVPHDQRRVE